MSMGLVRGVVFAGVIILPSLVLGLILYIVLGGNTSASVGSGEFMYGPCYGVPMLCIISAFIMGMSADASE